MLPPRMLVPRGPGLPADLRRGSPRVEQGRWRKWMQGACPTHEGSLGYAETSPAARELTQGDPVV